MPLTTPQLTSSTPACPSGTSDLDFVLQHNAALAPKTALPPPPPALPTCPALPCPQVNSEVDFMLQHNLANSHDGWIIDPMSFASFYDQKVCGP